MKIYLNGKPIQINPRRLLGQGGEAEVYRLNTHQALKLFKPPHHPDYAHSPQEQQQAQARLHQHQAKLPAFPQLLPDRVIRPLDLAQDDRRMIIGYTMSLLTGTEPLLRYSDRTFRQAMPTSQVVQIFQDLHDTVTKLHFSGIVIGDFNDLNILVKERHAYVIDADSFQFELFLCPMFTARFVDPKLCDPQANQPILNQPHTEESDWYAFTVMLMQSLLFVDPFGGLYKPKDITQKIPQAARPLHRISIFHPEVIYPKPALPYHRLPDDLLHHLQAVFVHDRRGEFPRHLLDQLQWQTCPTCGAEHARSQCPDCTYAAPGAVVAVTVIRGQVTATRVLQTEGLLQCVTVEAGRLAWVVWERHQFWREDGTSLGPGTLHPQRRWQIQGSQTWVGQDGQVVILQEGQVVNRLAVDSYGAIAQFHAPTATSPALWLQGGQLLRQGPLGPTVVGTILAERTQLWAGPTFGLGFAAAGALTMVFVCDRQRGSLNDRVQLPPCPGELIAATCTFSGDYVWFFRLTQHRGQLVRHCCVLDRTGQVLGHAQATIQDEHWLMQIGQDAIAQNPGPGCAVSNFLLVATDAGIIRIEIQAGQLVQTRIFADTEPFVDASTQLLAAPDGLYAVRSQEIQHLKLG